MLRHVTRQPANFVGELAQLLPERRVLAPLKSRQVVHLVVQLIGSTIGELGYELDFAKRQVERFPDFPHCRPQPVRGECAHQSRVLGAVARVHAADQLLADLTREVEIDVGH